MNELTRRIIGCAMTVHKKLGLGFLESVYQGALAIELQKAQIPFQKEKPMPVFYEGADLGVGFRCDFLVDGRVIVECKAVRVLSEVDEAQLLNYLRITNLQVGLLFNFNVMVLKEGLRRLVNNFRD